MDHNRIEPSTPPPSSGSKEYPATPATPRFGTFADLPDLPRKPSVKANFEVQTPARTQRRKRPASVLATPRQTPKRRENKDQCQIFLSTPQKNTLKETLFEGDFNAEESQIPEPRTPKRETSDVETDSHGTPIISRNAPKISFSTSLFQKKGFYSKDIFSSSSEAFSSHSEPIHPHMDKPPPNVPGMWYVFRGKRIFRPLPPGEKPMKPVTLFKDVIARNKAIATREELEEADTDVEDL